MRRRSFVLTIGAMAVALPALPEAGRLGLSDVQQVREMERRLVRLDDQYGSAQGADAAERCIRVVEEAMQRCTFSSDNVRRSMHQALGELCEQAGWMSYDAGQHTRARSWLNAASHHALLGQDTSLQARVLSTMSRQAVDLGDGSGALRAAKAGLEITRGRRDPRLSALLHTRIALASAASGQPGRVGQALHRAEKELGRAKGEAPPWLAFVEPAEITAQASLCYARLGQPKLAVKLHREVMKLRSEGFLRNRFTDHIILSDHLLAAGEADEALTVAHQALGFLPRVRSDRWAGTLESVRDRLSATKVPGSEEFAERYRQVVA